MLYFVSIYYYIKMYIYMVLFILNFKVWWNEVLLFYIFIRFMFCKIDLFKICVVIYVIGNDCNWGSSFEDCWFYIM